jgi:PPK2 family polyphosphate:nucleotide phosphotransferase
MAMQKIIHISTKAPSDITKLEANKKLLKLRDEFYSLQNLLYAEGKRSLLIILQGMDASGKDGTIRHVFSCVNPQGCNVKSFKTPTVEEKSHDFFWRIYPHLPAKGMIQIFNRSHYEDILFPVVHRLIDKKEIKERLKVINQIERHLQNSNTIILKFFLHVSKKEQQSRIAKRLSDPEKKWKFDPSDKKESKLWEEYIDAYQMMLGGWSKTNPWTIIPADDKWYRNYVVAKTIVKTLNNLKMEFPK